MKRLLKCAREIINGSAIAFVIAGFAVGHTALSLYGGDFPLLGITIITLSVGYIINQAEKDNTKGSEKMHEVYGKKIYDPRTGKREVSSNPALIHADLITSNKIIVPFHCGADFWDSIKQMADWCDSRSPHPEPTKTAKKITISHCTECPLSLSLHKDNFHNLKDIPVYRNSIKSTPIHPSHDQKVICGQNKRVICEEDQNIHSTPIPKWCPLENNEA